MHTFLCNASVQSLRFSESNKLVSIRTFCVSGKKLTSMHTPCPHLFPHFTNSVNHLAGILSPSADLCKLNTDYIHLHTEPSLANHFTSACVTVTATCCYNNYLLHCPTLQLKDSVSSALLVEDREHLYNSKQ